MCGPCWGRERRQSCTHALHFGVHDLCAPLMCVSTAVLGYAGLLNQYLQKMFNVAKLLECVVDVLQRGCILPQLALHLGDQGPDVPDLLANALLLLKGLHVGVLESGAMRLISVRWTLPRP